jgi:hypothetical protein
MLSKKKFRILFNVFMSIFMLLSIPALSFGQPEDSEINSIKSAEFKNDDTNLILEKNDSKGTNVTIEVTRKKVSTMNHELLDFLSYKNYETRQVAKYMVNSISVTFGKEAYAMSISEFYFMSDPESIEIEIGKNHEYKISIVGGNIIRQPYKTIFYFNKNNPEKMQYFDPECETPLWETIFHLCELG